MTSGDRVDAHVARLELDHLVFAPAGFDQGIAYVQQHLGVRLPAVGNHVFMGTHNAVMRLGNTTYFEIMAK